MVALAEGVLRRRQLDPRLLSASGRPLRWQVDAARIQQVLDNLLSNAAKYGGGAVAVTLSHAGQRLQIEVDDTGPGVPIEEREVVFDRFGRGRAAHVRNHADGIGLGLSLVAEHVSAHSGEVTILDRPGGGCRVRVTIPSGPK